MSKTRMFIGKVETVENNHVITFSIDNFADNLSPYPKAVAMTKLTRFPQVDDEVFIIQPDSDFEIFLYTLTSDDNFDISLNYDEATINLSKPSDDDYQIELNTSKDSSLVMNKDKVTITMGKSEIKMESSKVTINGHLEVTK